MPRVPQPPSAAAPPPALPPGAAAAARFFAEARADGGWTGADGTYSVPLDARRTAWIFGDTFLGGVRADGSRSTDPSTFVRLSAVVQDERPDGGHGFTTHVGSAGEAPGDLVRPPGARQNRDGSLPDPWYWPGHGWREGDDLVLLLNRFRHPTERDDPLAWDWRHVGTDVARLSADTLEPRSATTTPVAGLPRGVDDGSDVLWGAATVLHGDRRYVFGAEDVGTDARPVHVARLGEGGPEAPWEFWDGASWTHDATRSARLAGPRTGTQFGVVQAREGGLLLLAQVGLEPALRAWHADEPTGPWSGGEVVAHAPDTGGAGRHTYNAVPHPQHATADGSLPVTWNVGGADFLVDETTYRPRMSMVDGAALPRGGASRLAALPAQEPAPGAATAPEGASPTSEATSPISSTQLPSGSSA